MKYSCNTCNYETNDKSNLNRHMKSVAHILSTSMSTSRPTKVDIEVDNDRLSKFVCKLCGNNFSSRQSLSKHKKHVCNEKIISHVKSQIHVKCIDNDDNDDNDINDINTINDINDIDDDIKERLISYQQEIIKYQYQLKLKEFEIKNKYLKQQNNELKNFIKSGKHGNTYNVSVKNYVQQNYPNAPVLESLDDYAKIEYDDDNFIDTLTYNYNNKCLHKYLGDFIIKYYKKDDPTKQSMWSSDTSRLTYIVKELLVNNKSIWNHDSKGIKTKNYIINPLLKYIRICIDNFWILNLDNFKALTIDNLIKLQNTYQTIYKIKKDIESEILSNDIIRYITPHFRINKNEINEDNFIEYFIDY